MESYLLELDDYFCEQYADYVKLAALEGYEMPETVYVAPDGNISRRDSSVMRLCYQSKKAELLERLKKNLADTDISFSFRFRTLREKMADGKRKNTFAKLLPEALRHCGETPQSAGEKLNIEPRFWNKIVKGKLYPEKGTVLALALVCRMTTEDAKNLLESCGFEFDATSVSDIVTHYLIGHKIYNESMRNNCLAAYKIENLPIKREG